MGKLYAMFELSRRLTIVWPRHACILKPVVGVSYSMHPTLLWQISRQVWFAQPCQPKV